MVHKEVISKSKQCVQQTGKHKKVRWPQSKQGKQKKVDCWPVCWSRKTSKTNRWDIKVNKVNKVLL